MENYYKQNNGLKIKMMNLRMLSKNGEMLLLPITRNAAENFIIPPDKLDLNTFLNPEEAFEVYLVNEGFTVNMLGGRCPFQVEANHDSGISIYFRARGERVTLEIFDEWCESDDLPKDSCLIWEDEYSGYEKFAAGWLDYDQAFYAFYLLWSAAKDRVLE